MSEKVKSKPFLKWAGGKTQLLPELTKRLPTSFNRYFEPFLGSGALFFELKPEKAVLSDVNEELVNCYHVVKEHVNELIEDLSKHVYQKEYFYQLRDIDREPVYDNWGKIQRASRFLYLNKTCFNGLFRVNSKGHFNVPFGAYKNPKICDKSILLSCSEVLKNKLIVQSSFNKVLDLAEKGDFVYFDPPYMPVSKTASFTSYTKYGFAEKEQIELKKVCCELDRKGVNFLLSNSSNEFILGLYEDFHVSVVKASRAINSKASKRGKIREIIVSNY